MLPVLKRAVESLRRFSEGPVRLVVVNNGSRDGTAAYCAGLPDCELLDLPGNTGFVKAFSAGLLRTSAPFIARMDHDVEFMMPWRTGLLGALRSSERAGMAGPRLLNPDGTVYAAGFSFFLKPPLLPWRGAVRDPFALPRPLRRFVHFDQHANEPDNDAVFGGRREVFHVTGAFSVMTRAAFERTGMPDASYPDLNGAYEDLDYTLRMVKAGFGIVYEGGVKVVHHCARPEGPSTAGAPPRNKELFRQKWGFL
jgi:GT2 family glycosyltransferase